jgi:hypothetical protein
VTLQVCLSHVLDDGGDAMRVLDHLARAIASTHILTGASATRMAELLLSHHDIPALLGLVNDTLMSTYPRALKQGRVHVAHTRRQGRGHMPHQEAARGRWLGAHTRACNIIALE